MSKKSAIFRQNTPLSGNPARPIMTREILSVFTEQMCHGVGQENVTLSMKAEWPLRQYGNTAIRQYGNTAIRQYGNYTLTTISFVSSHLIV